jgi:glycosyltransferase involved in cell wall biosynthesis
VRSADSVAAPLLHILVPAFGASPYLGETLKSLSKVDNLEEIKVTVVDDASSNLSIKPLVEQFKNLSFDYIRNEKNLGLASNFQNCMNLSAGKFTLLLGSDDLVSPQILNILKSEILKNPILDLLHFKTLVIDTSGKRYLPLVDKVKKIFTPLAVYKAPLGGNSLLFSMLIGNWTYFPAIAWKTELRNDLSWNTNFKHAVDLALICNIATAGKNLKVSSGIGVYYRRHSESESSKLALTTTRVTEELYVHKLLLAKLPGIKNLHLRIVAHVAFSIRTHAFISALTHLKSQPKDALKILRISLSSLKKIDLSN